MGTLPDNHSTLGTDRSGPTRRITAVVEWTRYRIVAGLWHSSVPRVADAVLSIDSEEVDGESNLSERLHVMGDAGGYRLDGLGAEPHVEHRIALHHELQCASANSDQPPGTLPEAVRVQEAGRNRSVFPLRARSDQVETTGQLSPFAEQAVQRSTDSLGATLAVEHPGSELERRLMTNVLAVTTRELGDPIALLVSVESCNRSIHEPTVGPGLGRNSERQWRCTVDQPVPARRSAASTVWLRSMAMVIGPTPPGTGAMSPTVASASSVFTSPTPPG